MLARRVGESATKKLESDDTDDDRTNPETTIQTDISQINLVPNTLHYYLYAKYKK